MTDIMFRTPSDSSIEKVLVTPDCVNNGAQPLVFHKEQQTAS